MLSSEDALRQSQRLGELGYDMSPQRLQQISAGARPGPDEREAVRVAEVVAAIDGGISPETAAVADALAEQREQRKRVVLAAVGIAVAVLLIVLIVLV